MTRIIRPVHLGLQDYREVHQIQVETVEQVYTSDQDIVLVCSHPPVVTLGKQSTPLDLLNWSGDVHQIERGGRATYHGPNQLILYPILNLRYYGMNLGGYLRALENSLVEFCRTLGLVARGNPNYAGVWVVDPNDGLEKKLASIGIAVRRWITYHGIAINLVHDEKAFQGIRACGHEASVMTSFEKVLHPPFVRNDLEVQILNHLLDSLSQLSESCQALPDGRQ